MTRSRRHARGWAALPAAGLALACVLAPAAAYEPDSVEMSSDQDDAPVVEPGVHHLEYPAGDAPPQFLAVDRTIDGSTLWVGETVISDKVADNEQFSYYPVSEEGTSCGNEGAVEGSSYFGHEFNTGVTLSGPECADEDRIWFQHYLPSNPDSDYSDEGGRLVVWEEPPADPSSLPPPATRVTWSGQDQPAEGNVDLASSFEDAPELVDGRWDVKVMPGRTELFRVPLDWNQHVEVSLRMNQGANGEITSVEPKLITPLGGYAPWGVPVKGKGANAEEPPDGSGVTLYVDGDTGGAASPSITYRNREAGSDNPAAFPGMYYVQLQLGKADAPKSGVEMTMTVEVVTDKEPTSPYTTEGEPAPDVGGHLKEEEQSADGGGSSETVRWGVVSGLLGGSAVLTVLGFVSLGRYRRTRGTS